MMCSCGRAQCAPGFDLCRECEWEHYVRQCEEREHERWLEEQYEYEYEYTNLEQEHA